jgi:hypothetical protein
MFGKTALAAAAILAATSFSPALAGGHHGYGGHGGHGGHGDTLEPVVALDSPRGVDALGHGRTLVTEADGTFSLVVEKKHRDPKVIELGSVPAGFIAPAISAGPHGEVYVLTGGGEPGTGAATLYRWQWGDDSPTPVFDVAAYQQGDPDPYDLEDFPEDTNPFGVVALRDGSVLVSDAAGNDLIRVWPETGDAVTVARLKPRVVTVPEGFPATDPEGNPLPPAGTPLPSEGVATSVTVGPDGYWYVGELRGFPATPGTSEIWRIRPGSVDAVCDPEQPGAWRGRHSHSSHSSSCTRYADGLTSIVDLGADRSSVYAVTLSKQSWFAYESGAAGAEVGGLFRVTRSYGGSRIEELVPDQLILPGGVDVADNDPYVTGPVFGPGALSRID